MKLKTCLVETISVLVSLLKIFFAIIYLPLTFSILMCVGPTVVIVSGFSVYIGTMFTTIALDRGIPEIIAFAIGISESCVLLSLVVIPVFLWGKKVFIWWAGLLERL